MKTRALTTFFTVLILALAAILAGLIIFLKQAKPAGAPATFNPFGPGTVTRCPEDARLYSTLTDSADFILANAQDVCKLAVVGSGNFPFELSRFPHLKELSIHNTTLESLPPDIGVVNSLVVLNLAHNKALTELPSTLNRLPHLRVLRIESTAIAQLPSAALTGFPLLQYLYLNDGQLPQEQLDALQQASGVRVTTVERQ